MCTIVEAHTVDVLGRCLEGCDEASTTWTVRGITVTEIGSSEIIASLDDVGLSELRAEISKRPEVSVDVLVSEAVAE